MQPEHPDIEPAVRAGPTTQGWIALPVGGFFLTLAGAGIGSQLLMSMAGPGPAAPIAAGTIGIAGLSLVASTLIMGRLVGVRTRGQWLRAFVAVAAPMAAAVALVAVSVRPG